MDLRTPLSLLATLLLAACVVGAPHAPREYAGTLVGKTRWSGEVVIGDDVLIPAGSTLVIAPGTRVRVRPTQSTKIEPEQLSSATELLVRGRLESRGTPQEPVVFVIDGAFDAPVAWAGIIADRAERLELSSTVVRRAEQGVWSVATPGRIVASRFEQCRYGLVFQYAADFAVRDSLVADGEAGVFCWLGATPRLDGNRIRGQAEEGVFIDAESAPRLSDNRIENNGVGLAAADPGLASGNLLAGNGVAVLRLGGEP